MQKECSSRPVDYTGGEKRPVGKGGRCKKNVLYVLLNARKVETVPSRRLVVQKLCFSRPVECTGGETNPLWLVCRLEEHNKR